MAKILAIFVLSLCVSGCATTTISLQHPETEHSVACGGDVWTSTLETEECAQGFEQAGYVRIISF
jgi:uncharacterized protein YceK